MEIIKHGTKTCSIVFKNTVDPGVKLTQRRFVEACLKDGIYKHGEVIIVDNKDLNLDPGVAVFIDLASGICGFSHSMPGVIVPLFTEISRRQRPKLHWYCVFKGGALPNPMSYPHKAKLPW